MVLADRSSGLAAATYFSLTNSGRINLSHSAYFFRFFDGVNFSSIQEFLNSCINDPMSSRGDQRPWSRSRFNSLP